MNTFTIFHGVLIRITKMTKIFNWPVDGIFNFLKIFSAYTTETTCYSIRFACCKLIKLFAWVIIFFTNLFDENIR